MANDEALFQPQSQAVFQARKGFGNARTWRSGAKSARGRKAGLSGWKGTKHEWQPWYRWHGKHGRYNSCML